MSLRLVGCSPGCTGSSQPGSRILISLELVRSGGAAELSGRGRITIMITHDLCSKGQTTDTSRICFRDWDDGINLLPTQLSRDPGFATVFVILLTLDILLLTLDHLYDCFSLLSSLQHPSRRTARIRGKLSALRTGVDNGRS